ncbi:MAG TPA: hypothetical protein VG245_11635 [Candidatus Dormibacteraeota bacterium]|jgi:hypothetical protein|nr:hypothetical protein [Candidatus Dormibacteraeota bacterium]
MKRIIFAGMALAAVLGPVSAGAAATPTAYVCAQFQDPTVNHVWQTICYAPCAKRACT